MNSKESIGTLLRRIVISETPHGKIIALRLLLAFLWGGNSLSIKVTLDDIAPMALAFVRFIIGLVIVGGWALYRKIPLGINREELSRLSLLTAIFILHITLI